MLLQALAEFADRNLKDQLEDPAFEVKPVPVELQISAEGKFLGFVERKEMVQSGKKTIAKVLTAEVPRSPVNRNSGSHPLLAYDDAKYVFGVGDWTKPGQEEDHGKKHTSFVALIEAAAQATRNPGLEACALFFQSKPEFAQAKQAFDPKITGGILISVVPGGPVVQTEGAKQFWREHYQRKFGVRNEEGGRGMCLVSGEWGPVAPTHDKVKGAASLGGQAAGVALISFDKEAFESYGWAKNANSPVSPGRAQAYVMALNHLMGGRGKHRTDRMGTGFLFWLREESEWNPSNLLEEADPDEVRRLLELRATGWQGLQPNDFYFMAVKGNGGRLQVSQWIHESLNTVLDNVAGWFEGLRMVDCFQKEVAQSPKLWEVLAVLAREEPPAGTAIELTRRALLGQPIGLSVLHAALRRQVLEKGTGKQNAVRLGLIRLLVNDEIRKTGGFEMGEELNPDERAPAYLCGRLLALFDALQYQANGKVNMTVADRYYALASSQPRLAFPKLEQLGNRHRRKVQRENRGAAVAIDRKMNEIREALGKNYPEPFALVDQGRFALGYHHERAEGIRRAVEAKARHIENIEEGEA